jgi:hypothetical protein
MKLVALLFLCVLGAAHLAGDPAELLARPLSMFRDGPLRPFGYALFALLLTATGLMIAAAWLRHPEHAAFFALAASLLVLVAVTPSQDTFHLLLSLLLLTALFGYFAVVLYRRAGGGWFVLHLSLPLLLVALTRCHSYGLWQKSLILYFLLAANVQHHLLACTPPRRRGAALGPRHRNVWCPPRRVVYTLEAGRCWARRR